MVKTCSMEELNMTVRMAFPSCDGIVRKYVHSKLSLSLFI